MVLRLMKGTYMVKNNIFVDTSAWIALFNLKDKHHKIAIEYFLTRRNNNIGFITSNFILDETLTWLLYDIGYAAAIDFYTELSKLIQSEIVKLERISEKIESQAWKVFKQYNVDKSWSYTDCTSKMVMEILSSVEVFAFDSDFDQMGFIRVPN